ncbi:hypothetical protein [Flavipsychrobacter stenotrophus]|nr:hypothetical protein [Flavipsychrobacter stenotrophus]
MRRDPEDKYADAVAYRKEMTIKITRFLAIVMAFLSTFFFFIKLLFL